MVNTVMQMLQHEKAAKAEMQKLKLSASLELVKILEMMPEVSSPKSGNLFIHFSPNRPEEAQITDDLSAYNIIHRNQSHILTSEISPQELEMIRIHTNKKMNYPFKSYDDFLAYGFDRKYVFINGRVHRKLDSREPNFIAAVRSFINQYQNDHDFQSKHPQVFFAYEIIPNLNSILTLHLLKIPELAGKGKLNSENFMALMNAYDEITNVYKKLTDAVGKTALIPEKDRIILVNNLEKEKENLQNHIINTISLDKTISSIEEQISQIQKHHVNLNEKMKKLSESKDNYNHKDISAVLSVISQIVIDSDHLSPYLKGISKFVNKDKNARVFASDALEQLRAYKDQVQVRTQELMKYSIHSITNISEKDTQREALYKLLITCLREKNETAINSILTNKSCRDILQSFLEQKNKPQYVTDLDKERLSEVSSDPLVKQLCDHFFPAPSSAISPPTSSALISNVLSSSSSAPPPLSHPFDSPLATSSSPRGTKTITSSVGPTIGATTHSSNPASQQSISGPTSHSSAKTDSRSTPPTAPHPAGVTTATHPTLAMSKTAKPAASSSGSVSPATSSPSSSPSSNKPQ